MIDPFNRSEYVFYKYAGAVEVFDCNGNSVLYAEREGANKLGKPIHVHTNKYRTKELLTISSPKGRKELVYTLGDSCLRRPFGLPFSIIPLNMEYRVTDAVTGEIVGSVVQKSMQKITKDEWILISGGNCWQGEIRSIHFPWYSLAKDIRNRSAGWKSCGQIQTTQGHIKFQIHYGDNGSVYRPETSCSSRYSHRYSESFILSLRD